MLVLCFAPYGNNLLAYIAMVPFLVSLFNLTPRQGFVSGFVMGMVYLFGANYWVYHSMHVYGNMNLVLSIAAVLLLCMYLSIYIGVFGIFFNIRCADAFKFFFRYESNLEHYYRCSFILRVQV